MKLILIIILTLTITPQVFAKDIKIALVRPGDDQNLFWTRVSKLFEKSANDLNMQYKTYAAGDFIEAGMDDVIGYMKALDEAIASNPDYLITFAVQNEAFRLMKKTRERGTKVFLINSTLKDQDLRRLGPPRHLFKNWIGHMYPDDEQAGYDLAKILIARSKQLGFPHPTILGITGETESSPGFLRAEGLKRALKEHPEVSLADLLYIYEWAPERASEKATEFLMSKPALNIIWTASDAMSLKIGEQAKNLGRTLNQGLLIGGVDGLDEALQSIESNEMTASMSGHMMEAAFAAVLIHDYHHGIDFSDSIGATIKSKMMAIHHGNIEEIKSKIRFADLIKTDFRSLSRFLNQQRKSPVVDLGNLLNATAKSE